MSSDDDDDDDDNDYYNSHLKPEDFLFGVFKEGDDVLFGFTSKTYWEEHKCLDDRQRDPPGLPNHFGNEMEAIFSYNGNTEDGIDALLKAGFLRSLEMEEFLQGCF